MLSLLVQIKLDKTKQDEWFTLISPSEMQTTTPKGTIHIEVFSRIN
jgi:hypothetical protein